MPNYALYSPDSTPPQLVIAFYKSFPREREGELGPNVVRDPTIEEGTILSKQLIWDGSVIRNLSGAEQAALDAAAGAEQAAQQAASAAAVKQAAKNIFVTPTGAYDQALKLAFETMLVDLYLPQINTLRSAVGLGTFTAGQLQVQFKAAFEARVDAL